MQRFASLTRLSLVCLALAVMPIQSVVAAAAKAPDVAAIKPLADWQTRTKSHLTYIGTRYGMDVWIATRDSMMQLIYTTPDKQAMLLDGSLIGANDEDATAELQREFVAQNPQQAEAILQVVNGQSALPGVEPAAAPTPQPAPVAAHKPAKSELLWQDLTTKAATVSFGPATAPTAYMIVDLSCEHCKILWHKIQPALQANTIQIKLVPIAILGKESADRGAALLSQPNPADAWLIHAKGDKEPTNVTAAGTDAFARNQAILSTYKLSSTPILVYRNKGQDKVKMVLGSPASMDGIWADLGLGEPPAETPEPAKTN